MFSSAPYNHVANEQSASAPVIVQGHAVSSNTNNSAYASPYHHGSVVVPASNTNNAYNKDPSYPMTSAARPQPVQRGCRDVIWGILFYLHLAFIVCLAGWNGPQAFSSAEQSYSNGGYLRRHLDDAGGNTEGGTDEISINPAALISILGVAAVAGAVVSSLALGFMMSFAESLIKMALIFNIGLFAVVAVISLLTGAWPGALLGGLGCAFAAYYAYCVWSRVPFAAANLVTAVTAVRANLGLTFYAYISLLWLILWSLLWTVSTVSTMMVLGQCSSDGACASKVSGIVIFLFLISYFWTIQVITNVVYVCYPNYDMIVFVLFDFNHCLTRKIPIDFVFNKCLLFLQACNDCGNSGNLLVCSGGS